VGVGVFVGVGVGVAVGSGGAGVGVGSGVAHAATTVRMTTIAGAMNAMRTCFIACVIDIGSCTAQRKESTTLPHVHDTAKKASSRHFERTGAPY
jgi:hypothetical protein